MVLKFRSLKKDLMSKNQEAAFLLEALGEVVFLCLFQFLEATCISVTCGPLPYLQNQQPSIFKSLSFSLASDLAENSKIDKQKKRRANHLTENRSLDSNNPSTKSLNSLTINQTPSHAITTGENLIGCKQIKTQN